MKTKKLTISEYQECLLLVDYLNILKQQGKVLAFAHIPNSTYTTSWSQKRKNKALGVSSGFPDYIILLRGTMLFIEMKKEKGGVVSKEQEEWLEMLDRQSNTASKVCHGFEEAKEYLDWIA